MRGGNRASFPKKFEASRRSLQPLNYTAGSLDNGFIKGIVLYNAYQRSGL